MKAILATLALAVPATLTAEDVVQNYFLETSQHRNASIEMFGDDTATVNDAVEFYTDGITVSKQAFNKQLDICMEDAANLAKIEVLVLMARSNYRKVKLLDDFLQRSLILESLGDTRPGAIDEALKAMRDNAKIIAVAESDLSLAEAMQAMHINANAK